MARDVCVPLGLKDHNQSTRCLDADEKGLFTIHTLGGPQKVAIVNESGLYSLILRSRVLEAKKFKRWVTHEVLPAIRKTGSYSVPPQLPDFNDPIAAAQAWIEAKQEVKDAQS